MRYFIAVIGLAAALYGADAAREQTLQKGIDLLETKGDVAGAVTAFESAARSADRAVAARALLYLARAQEGQGKERARATYERIAREFGDQRDIAGQAREWLAALKGATAKSGLTARQIWAGEEISGTTPREITLAPDGHSLLMTDWNSGDIAVRDLRTGAAQSFGLKKSWTESPAFAQYPVYSVDQRQIAYTSWNGKSWDFSLMPAQQGAKPRVLIKGTESNYFRAFGWSSDGKSILALVWEATRSDIAWVSVADGSLKTVKSLRPRQMARASLSPDGRYIAYEASESQNSSDGDIFIAAVDGSREMTAVKSPGMDNNPVWTPDGNHLLFISDRARNFGLYALSVQAGKPQGEPKLLKSDIGPITLTGFDRSGALYYLLPTGEQNVYRIELNSASQPLRAPLPLGSTYTANNSMSALSPDGKQVAYLATRAQAEAPSLAGASGAPATVVVKTLAGTEKSFPTDLLVGWAPMWFRNGNALLLSARRPVANTGQDFYRLDLDSGKITRLLENGVNWNQPGPARGQRELAADGDTVYLSVNGWGSSSGDAHGGVAAVSLSTGQVRKIYETADAGTAVLALSLSPDGRQLAVTTISTTRGTTNQFYPGQLVVMNADGSGSRSLFESNDLAGTAGVAWSSDGKEVLFVRSGTGTTSDLWRVPAGGGDPSFTGVRGRGLREIRGGPDGMLTYTEGSTNQAELWALDNLLPLVTASR